MPAQENPWRRSSDYDGTATGAPGGGCGRGHLPRQRADADGLPSELEGVVAPQELDDNAIERYEQLSPRSRRTLVGAMHATMRKEGPLRNPSAFVMSVAANLRQKKMERDSEQVSTNLLQRKLERDGPRSTEWPSSEQGAGTRTQAPPPSRVPLCPSSTGTSSTGTSSTGTSSGPCGSAGRRGRSPTPRAVLHSEPTALLDALRGKREGLGPSPQLSTRSEPASRWVKYMDSASGKFWWCNEAAEDPSADYFFEGDPEWKRYIDDRDARFWWFHEPSERYFYEEQEQPVKQERACLPPASVDLHELLSQLNSLEGDLEEVRARKAHLQEQSACLQKQRACLEEKEQELIWQQTEFFSQFIELSKPSYAFS